MASLAASTPDPTLALGNPPFSTSIDGSSSPSSSSSSVSSGSSDYDEEEEARIAAEEWDRLVGQTKMLLGLAIPFLAGFAGRKFGLKVFQRYLSLGLGKAFWLGWTGLVAVGGSVGRVGLGARR